MRAPADTTDAKADDGWPFDDTLASRRRKATAGNGRGPGDRRGVGRLFKRYGPLVVIIAVLVAGFVVFSQGGDDGGGSGSAAEPVVVDHEQLVRSGPMTPERAELEGVTVDFGPRCDTATGRIALPTVYAPPCVEPFTGDNGGATSPGVTAETIKLVAYVADPALDPLSSAMVGATGADLDPERMTETLQGYVDLYNETFETYGRRVELETFTGTGAADDQAAAKADAIAIAEGEPFAVVGGPRQASDAFADELAARGVLCLQGCALGLPESFLAERAPYVWMMGMTPNQNARLAAEVVANLAGPGPAEMAGDPEVRASERVYAVVHYVTPEGLQQESFEELRDGLADRGIELATDIEFFLDTARVQETARTIIAELEAAGVTTVIFTGDPLTPGALTTEATAQDYHPEWILGPNFAADTALFARTYDQEQWSHGFGIAGVTPDTTATSTHGSLYQWAYGTPPPSNLAGTMEPSLRTLFIGVHLAGPELSPEAFRDGLFRYPPSGEGPTRVGMSWGDHDMWSEVDYADNDNLAITWWDPEAVGEDEAGAEGAGMYRFANGGQRYGPGEIPATPEDAGLFQVDRSVIQYDQLPPEDATPTYPPPS